MKKWHTFNWDVGKKFNIFGMLVIPNKKNFTFELIPSVRFDRTSNDFSLTISWLSASIEFHYTIKAHEANV